jgi:hypothetical protein
LIRRVRVEYVVAIAQKTLNPGNSSIQIFPARLRAATFS